MTQIDADIPWPPPYTLRKHKRARRVIFKASRQYGLEVTVPARFNVNEIPTLLETHKAWISRQLATLYRPIDTSPPTLISLAAKQQTWQVQYYQLQSRLRYLERPGYELAILGEVDDATRCKAMLERWVKAHAKTFLHERMQSLSERTGLTYTKLTIRGQKSRWGSCTSAGAINLNYKLIFLPPHLAEHIIIHELSHTQHMNHSKRFWSLVARHDPNYREHRRAMRQADQWVPDWLQE